jgi:hypothetical protein
LGIKNGGFGHTVSKTKTAKPLYWTITVYHKIKGVSMSDQITKEVIHIFKEEGLMVAEDMAVNAVKAVLRIVEMVVPKVSTGLGLAIGPLIRIYEPKILAMLDKIDGQDDPDY